MKQKVIVRVTVMLNVFVGLAGKLQWWDPLWEVYTCFQKNKTKFPEININSNKTILNRQGDLLVERDDGVFVDTALDSCILDYCKNPGIKEEIAILVDDDLASSTYETAEHFKE